MLVGRTPYSFQQIRGRGPLSLSSRGESVPHTPRSTNLPLPRGLPSPTTTSQAPDPPPWSALLSESDPVALGSESRPRLHLRLAPNSCRLLSAAWKDPASSPQSWRASAPCPELPRGPPRPAAPRVPLPLSGLASPAAGRGESAGGWERGRGACPSPTLHSPPPGFLGGGRLAPPVGAADTFRAPKGLLTARWVQLSFRSRRRRLRPPAPGSFLAPTNPPPGSPRPGS